MLLTIWPKPSTISFKYQTISFNLITISHKHGIKNWITRYSLWLMQPTIWPKPGSGLLSPSSLSFTSVSLLVAAGDGDDGMVILMVMVIVVEFVFSKFYFQALLLPSHQPAWGGRGLLHHGGHWRETRGSDVKSSSVRSRTLRKGSERESRERKYEDRRGVIVKCHLRLKLKSWRSD